MKINDLRKNLSLKLESCSFEDASFEADCIVADIVGVTNSMLRLMTDDNVSEENVLLAESYVERRLSGEPLQYILGVWEFYGNSFYVGEGVLIPRPETELLVHIALDFIKGKNNPVCIDLCSGSGCIGISVAKADKNANVILLEKSEDAFSYLQKNITYNSVSNVSAVIGDLFDGPEQLGAIKFDVLFSNPPYIRTDVIPILQREVQAEPVMALDGGEDGLDFYRAIAEKWFKCIKSDGLAAVEIGDEQGSNVKRIFENFFSDVKIIKDLYGNDRIVTAKNKITE